MIPKYIVQSLLLLAATLPLAARANTLTYSAEPIAAQVIDADTKKPLEGVVVTANWQLEQGTAGGNIQAGQLMVMEAVTDNEGKFSFPAWGPKTTRESFLVNDDPQLLLFKSGYEYRRLNNPYSSDRELRLRPVRRSVWNGRVIALKLFREADMQTQYKNLLNFSKEVDSFATWHIDPCQWTKLPISVSKMFQERKKLEAQGAKSVWDRTLDQGLLENEENFIKACGSTARDFFETFREIKQ